MGLGSNRKYGKSSSISSGSSNINASRRTKLSHDPNNTAWSRSTTNYGQRIMLSQGWIPGSILGASNPLSADVNTKTTSCYPRTTRRDDNCGLGGSRRGDHDDSRCTGLDVFQGILGRLNGRVEANCEAAKFTSEDLKTVNYLESRWQVLKFVSGGVLSGDKLEDFAKQPDQTPSSPIAQVVTTSDNLVNQELEDTIRGIYHAETSNATELRNSKRPKTKKTALEYSDSSAKRQLGSMKQHSPDLPESQVTCKSVELRPQQSEDSGYLSKTRVAASERKKRKKMRRMMDTPQEGEQPSHPSFKEGLEMPLPLAAESQTPSVVRGALASRHVVRARYIRQKKMAMMDTKALNEVCHFSFIEKYPRNH